MSASIDMSQVLAFAQRLRNAAALGTGGMGAALMPVMDRAGVQMKNQMRTEAMGHKHAPRLPFTIDYSKKVSNAGIEIEVGPKKGGPGSLAFYYYGNSKIGPSIPDPMGALRAEATRTEAQLTLAAVNAIIGGMA